MRKTRRRTLPLNPLPLIQQLPTPTLSHPSPPSTTSQPPPMPSPEPPLKRIKIEPGAEPPPDGPNACTFCFSTIRNPGGEPDALFCGRCRTVSHRLCAGEEWAETCMTCRGRVEKWKRPEGPKKGDEVVVVDDDDDGGDGKEAGRAEESGGGAEEEKEAEEEVEEQQPAKLPRKRGPVIWYRCDFIGCDYKSKQIANLKQHKAHIHDLDVRWFNCDQCEYKCKYSSALKSHKARRVCKKNRKRAAKIAATK